MSPSRPRTPAPAGSGREPRITAAAFFKLLWDALIDLLGTAASAALVGRAARRAERQHPDLSGLCFTRVDLEWGYQLPEAFEREDFSTSGLDALLTELRPLLTAQTGPVAIRRLAQVPELSFWAAVPSPQPSQELQR